MSTRRLVAGADGCRGGWVVATAALAGRTVTIEATATLTATVDAVHRGALAVLGVDMPIGLPEHPPRAADLAARAQLSPRGSTVFPTPPRSLLSATTYEEANERSRELYGTGLTRQTFNLFPKIRELDALVDPDDAVVEIHPELSFATMAGTVLPPKRSPAGISARVEALTREFAGVARLAASLPRSVAAVDDVLDALAVLWSTRRFAQGQHVELGDGTHDGRGLPMRIVC